MNDGIDGVMRQSGLFAVEMIQLTAFLTDKYIIRSTNLSTMYLPWSTMVRDIRWKISIRLLIFVCSIVINKNPVICSQI